MSRLALLLVALPASAQQTIHLPAEDHWLVADFEDVYRIGSPLGAEWEQFGYVRKVAFDGVRRLYVFDGQDGRLFVVGTDGTLGRAAWWPSSSGTSRGLETVAVKRVPREVN